MKLLPRLFAFCLCSLLIAGSAPVMRAQAAAPAATVDASAALPKRANARFYELHASFLKRAKEGPVGVLFLGDSITEGWTKAPAVWQEHFGKYQPANFGIGGDQTQHVIWRIEDGELDGIRPKVVVLMIGTNNSGSHTGGQIAAADEKIVGLIRARLPEAKVLLLAIFPRGPRAKNKEGVFTDDGVKRMAVIHEANARLARLDDGKIPDAIMPDQLHPNAEGYRLWAEAMQPLLDELMK